MPQSHESESPTVLLVAEHASAAFGGEALIPFQYFKHLREMEIDVHLLVHERTKHELCEAFATALEQLHFVSDSLLNQWCYRIGRFLPDRLADFTFGFVSHMDTQFRQRRMAHSLIRKFNIDIVHEPIPVSPKLPSILSGLAVPVVIGPMNGGMDYPQNFNMATRLERLVISSLRFTASFWNLLLPGKRQAALLLVANKRTRDALPALLRQKNILEFVENGVDLSLFRPNPNKVSSGKLRIIYIGRMVDWKRVDLLIEACAGLNEVDFELDLVGDGPMREALTAQVQRLSLAGRVRFHGRLAQSLAAEMLRNADVMVLPSMRECGGAVVLEAMASGVPVIAAKWGGPEDYMTAETGVLIPPVSHVSFVDELTKALFLMAKDPKLRMKMGEAGRLRAVELYGWKAKAETLLRIYTNVLMTKSISMNAK